MASVYTDKNGSRCVQFKNRNGKRKTLRLGKIRMGDAEEFARKLEHVLAAQLSGLAPPTHVALWLKGLGSVMINKLVDCDVLDREQAVVQAAIPRLGEFLDRYVENRSDVGPRTKMNLKQATGFLLEHFGRDRQLKSITVGNAADYRRWLLTKVGDNTARRHCGRAKQFFRYAVDCELIAVNPFGKMKETSVRANKAREYFISVDQAKAVLDACPDLQWRLIFALARFGGLRTPSETSLLKLSDVDWERDRIRITSPKTKHHEGKGERWIPLFPELRTLLLEVAERAEPGTEYVITRHRDQAANLRTHMERIIKRAGLTPWPKLFQNLRASRQTELAQRYPIHVVCAWLGNSQPVAAKHYLQVRDEDFASAAALHDALQNTANTTEQSGTTEEQSDDDSENSAVFACVPSYSDSLGVIEHPQQESNL